MIHSVQMRGRTVVPALATIALTVALTSGCGGSSGSAQVAQLATTPSTTTEPGGTTPTATTQDFQSAVLAYTGCLRSHGFQIADPDFSGGAGSGRGLFGQLRADRNNPKFKKADAQCRSLLAASRPQISTARRQQFQDAALKFAQCMRKNGVDVPDPNFSQGGGAGGGGLFGGSGLNRNDPKVQKATQVCRKVFTNAGLGGGRFGGGGGGAPPGQPG